MVLKELKWDRFTF